MTGGSFKVVRSYFRLPPEPGGMEEHIARLSAEQRQLGVEVVNVFNVGRPEGDALQLFPGRDLLGVRPALLRNALFYGRATMHAGRLRDARPVVLHVHGAWSDFLFGRLLGRAIGADVLAASLHDLIPVAQIARHARVLKAYGPIFSTGKADQLLLEEALGRPVHHLPSAPNDAFLVAAPPAPPFRYDVVTVTNFFEKKAPGLVLDCARRRPDLRFGLIGAGPLEQMLRARIAREGIGNVEMPGRLPREQIIGALRASRLFLSTAYREGTPTAALEAMAVGLPVLLTPSNDYRWLIEQGWNGQVTSGWEVDELVAALDTWLAGDARSQAVADRNRARARAHSWRANAERVTGLMSESLEGARRR